MKYKHLILSALCVVAALLAPSSCAPVSGVAYLQDIQAGVPLAIQETKAITLKRGDRLQVKVYSRDTEMAKLFNLSSEGPEAYAVDSEGKIDMPVLGLLAVEGLTREEVAALVKYRLLSAKLLRDPVVHVDYAQVGCYVMGEVGHAGRVEFTSDHITLLEALSLAGDLTINGRRDNVLVMRTENGRQTPYRVNLTKTESVYASPVYYLQQNDLIYVEPNAMRSNESSLTANMIRTPSFWFSCVSTLTTIILFLLK